MITLVVIAIGGTSEYSRTCDIKRLAGVGEGRLLVFGMSIWCI